MLLSRINLITNHILCIKAGPAGSLGGNGKHGRLKICAHMLSYRFESDSEYLGTDFKLPVSYVICLSIFEMLNHYLFLEKIKLFLSSIWSLYLTGENGENIILLGVGFLTILFNIEQFNTIDLVVLNCSSFLYAQITLHIVAALYYIYFDRKHAQRI